MNKINKLCLIGLFALGCTGNRPSNSVPNTPTFVQVECRDEESTCLGDALRVCHELSFDGFVVERKTSGTISIIGESEESGFKLQVRCTYCGDTKRTCYD